MKFKVGDKVNVKEFNCTGTVIGIYSNELYPYLLEIIEGYFIFTFYFPENDLELINETSSSNDNASIN
ncbi:hypothetical protein VK86_11300 [Moellerella wisconsensis]|nr:hypothetical protein VK86_11300 [Moellerella wisconsensis]